MFKVSVTTSYICLPDRPAAEVAAATEPPDRPEILDFSGSRAPACCRDSRTPA